MSARKATPRPPVVPNRRQVIKVARKVVTMVNIAAAAVAAARRVAAAIQNSTKTQTQDPLDPVRVTTRVCNVSRGNIGPVSSTAAAQEVETIDSVTTGAIAPISKRTVDQLP